ncbi:putrescine-binding periplasmic protein [Steroidobacter agaridevorans]|uniref:Putrescine-binding periplasmic protein n=1 Tax=Steroidobacter agaridevorans TaxID=2695856 RepID=A0A829YQG0_9GAMM|nr:polyamine ABC transporter substrate-binding protein [Steroidobacter agaridevorans]GFE85002.1 putrescine-binding periplasmic protein [Steroidobacter agaridevorans]GFE91689.1 putrescine-binding periplasmic protein [Steroidobacter agaridevorans]
MSRAFNSTLRAGLAVTAIALAVAACGKKEEAQQAEAPGAAAAEEKVLHVYNWSDYIAEDTIKNFEEKTGIKVTYDVFDSNDMLETRLLAGNSGFDVVVPSASFLERQIKAGVFQKLDKSQLPNLANMDPDIQQRVALHDPGNEHSVTYLWGTTGIGYNVDKVKKILGDTPLDSWNQIFDPKEVAKFKDCGISVLDAPDEILKVVLQWMGRDPNSQKDEDLTAAAEKLQLIRPYIRKIHSSQYIDDLANGDLCIAIGWSGDILQARDRAAEAGQGVKVAYSIPKEGTIVWFDMLAIPADAKHPKNAHAFINYLMEPQVAANNSNFVNYANANAASFAMVNDTVKNDPGVYPTPEVKAKLFPSLAYGEQATATMARLWQKFTTGQ